jgi:hypothetical protein
MSTRGVFHSWTTQCEEENIVNSVINLYFWIGTKTFFLLHSQKKKKKYLQIVKKYILLEKRGLKNG